MSILLGPFDKNDKPKEALDADNELLVFGYACKLYRNDSKAIMENSGQLLIPWMGDSSLMVDRYDVRNRLEDKSQFGLKPNLAHRMSDEERTFQEQLNMERYLALEWDEIRVEEQEEEEKRKRESAFSAVGFVYGDSTPTAVPAITSNGPAVDSSVPSSQDVSTSSVDQGERDGFIPPPGLIIPNGIQVPSTNKLHSIIEKTASFTSRQGTQMEIIIKTKQKRNPFFSFLNYNDPLFPYYKHLKDVIKTGAYQPLASNNGTKGDDSFGLVGHTEDKRVGHTEDKRDGLRERTAPHYLSTDPSTSPDGLAGRTNGRNGTTDNNVAVVEDTRSGEVSESDSDDDSDDGGYLHPLLMNASLSKSHTPAVTSEAAPPTTTSAPPTTNTSWVPLGSKPTIDVDKKMSLEELLSLHTSIPSFSASRGEATSAQETYSDAEAQAAYEHYRQQYYGSAIPPPPMGSGQSGGGHGYYPSAGHAPHDAYYEVQHDQFLANGGPHHQHPHYPDQYDGTTHYAPQQQQQQQQPQFPVPPLEVRPIVDKTAEYVAKNSEDFERTVLEKHIDDPRFRFLNPWDQYHAYYTAIKQYFRDKADQETKSLLGAIPMPPDDTAKVNKVQKLSSSGSVSFKLQPKMGAASGELPGPCSEFNKDVYLEDGEEGEAGIDVVEEEEEACPPPKKPKVEAEDDDDDHIGNTVKAFLSTVKGLFGTETSS